MLDIMFVLELDYLVHSGRRWSSRRTARCWLIMFVSLIGIELKLGLLSLLVLLSVGV